MSKPEMRAPLQPDQLRSILQSNASGIAGVSELFKEMMVSIEYYSSQASQVIYRELETLSQFIAEANAEIVAIRPKDISDLHLPGAADELDAVVSHTEQAANAIFSAVETIESVIPSLPAGEAEKATAAVTQIYEACSFQDLTGQRIGKVLRALKEVENRLGALLVAFGGKPADRAQGPLAAQPGSLLNGPQLPQDTPNQADIDAMFG